MVNWISGFPESAPKGKDILVSGIFRPSTGGYKGGDEIVVVTNYSSYMSDGVTGYHWVGIEQWSREEGIFKSYNVDWTHWAEVPKRLG